MRPTTSTLLALGALLCCVVLPAACDSPKCPPAGFTSVPNFDLAAFIAAPWYPQKQVPLIYQKEEDLNCVQSQYRRRDASKLSAGLWVYNYANKGRVNGSIMGSSPGSDSQTVAFLESDSGPTSKLTVGPQALEFAKFVAYGPYWVVAVGNSSNTTYKYEWAVVSGGAPKYKKNSACSTFLPLIPTTWQYTGGLWLFTRKSVDSVSAAAAEAAAKGLGIDTSSLKAVRQAGCRYPAEYPY